MELESNQVHVSIATCEAQETTATAKPRNNSNVQSTSSNGKAKQHFKKLDN